MSIIICKYCGEPIDTDEDTTHEEECGDKPTAEEVEEAEGIEQYGIRN